MPRVLSKSISLEPSTLNDKSSETWVIPDQRQFREIFDKPLGRTATVSVEGGYVCGFF